MEEELTKLFIFVDDFCKSFEPIWDKFRIENGINKRIWNLISQTEAWNNYANKKKFKIAWRFNKTKARKSFCYESLHNKHSEKLI